MNVRTGKGRLYAAELVSGRIVPAHVREHIFDSVGKGWIVAMVFCTTERYGHDSFAEDAVMGAVWSFCSEALSLVLASPQDPRPITNLKRNKDLSLIEVVLPPNGVYWETACTNAGVKRPEGFVHLGNHHPRLIDL